MEYSGLSATLYGVMAALVAFSIVSSLVREGVRSSLERSFLLFSFATFCWNATYAIMTLCPDPASVRAVYRVGSFAWGADPSIAACYAYLLYCHYIGRPVSRRVVALLFVPVPLIVYGVFAGRLLAVRFEPSPFGWIEVVDPLSPWNYAFLVLMLFGLTLFVAIGIRLSRTARTNRARLHGRLITYPVAAMILLVIVFHILLPILGLQRIPPVIQQLLALWIVAVSLTHDRYPVLSLSPLIAADAIVRSMSDICLLVDSDGRLRGANPVLGELLGIAPDSIIGRRASEVMPSPLVDILSSPTLLREGKVAEEAILKASDGTPLPCVATATAVSDSLEDKVGWVLIVREIREEKRLQTLSETDPLTGTLNRRKMEEELARAVSDHRKKRRNVSIVMIDLDRFKEVNDLFGHETGDKVLIEFCGIVRNTVRENDLFARWGGEEFIMLCTDAGEAETAVLAERIRERLEGFVFPHGGKVTASFGVAEFRAGDSVESLVRRSDEALYAAKAAGRNRVTSFSNLV